MFVRVCVLESTLYNKPIFVAVLILLFLLRKHPSKAGDTFPLHSVAIVVVIVVVVVVVNIRQAAWLPFLFFFYSAKQFLSHWLPSRGLAILLISSTLSNPMKLILKGVDKK